MLRSSWIASELLTTFANESKLTSVTMVNQSPPLSEGGIFCVSASSGNQSEGDNDRVVLWDRKVQGRFPESKEVKQLVRDCVNPDIDLGHSDNKQPSTMGSNDDHSTTSVKEVDCIECKEQQEDQPTTQHIITPSNLEKQPDEQPSQPPVPSIFYKHNHISIEYSTGSSIDSPENALYRATYYASELLSMIYERNAWWKKKQQEGDGSGDVDVDEEDVPVAVDSVTLVPNRLESGILKVKLNDHEPLSVQSGADSITTIMDGSHLRDVVKEAILNGGNLNVADTYDDTLDGGEVMDDDEAEEARKYFGVF